MIRCFVCVEVINLHNINEIKTILDYIAQFKSIRPVKLNQLHLTLKFLGDVPEEKISSLKSGLEKISQKKILVEFANLGFFPNIHRPRVMWIGISQGNQQLTKLSNEINDTLLLLGFPKEKRKFSAHLTLGRFKTHGKQKINPDDQMRIIQYAQDYGTLKGEIEILSSFFLKKSTLTPQGALYDNIAEFKLKE